MEIVIHKTQMPAEGTDLKIHYFSVMSIATYRGVKYDTDVYAKRTHQVQAQEVYRGIKHDEKVEVTK